MQGLWVHLQERDHDERPHDPPAPALVSRAGSGHPQEQGDGIPGPWEQAKDCEDPRNVSNRHPACPNNEGIIPPVFDYNAGSPEKSSTLRPGPSSSSQACMAALRNLPSAPASITDLRSTAGGPTINIYPQGPGTPPTRTTVESHCRKGTRGHRSSGPVCQRRGT